MDREPDISLEFVAGEGVDGWYACVCLTDTLGIPLWGPFDTEREAIAACNEIAADGAKKLRAAGLHAFASNETN